ncbi:MAG: signal peptidase II [Actinomycetota bacterium]
MAWLKAGLVAIAVIAIDQATKALVVANIARGQHRDFILGIDFTHVRNDGIAFGFFGGGGAALTAITLVAVVGLVAYFATHTGRRWLWLPTGLLVGGAIGNLIDRIHQGNVTDFIDLSFWPTFNVADMAITIGVLVLVLTLESGSRDDPQPSD